jgi:hypothetical protein
MSPLGILFVIVTGWMVLVCRRETGPVPLLIAVLYVPRSQIVQVGSLSFPVIRILILLGFLRILVRREGLAGGKNKLDGLILAWALWLLCSELFRTGGVSMVRMGDVFTALGVYFLFRSFLTKHEDLEKLFQIVCILLVPIAICMLFEKATGRDVVVSLFGESDFVALRHGHFRARGPYANAILAGTTGAACLPMALYLWRQNRKVAVTGLAAISGIILASGSSGPINTAAAAVCGIAFWRYRAYLPLMRWGVVLLVLALDIVMKDPVYYLVARLDVHAGSTGWYRARLIQGAIEHFSDWWLLGTDYTHDRVPEGTSGVVGNHADITNQFIQMGVWGGVPLMLLFTAIVVSAFSTVGRSLKAHSDSPFEQRLMIWLLGVTLFAHAVTFMSVSYFDPAVILLFYLIVASIGSICLAPCLKKARVEPFGSEIGPQDLTCHA